jgi:hypothetical protein
MVGVLTALIAGVTATRNSYRKPTQARRLGLVCAQYR